VFERAVARTASPLNTAGQEIAPPLDVVGSSAIRTADEKRHLIHPDAEPTGTIRAKKSCPLKGLAIPKGL
jgi:hypothetical protein